MDHPTNALDTGGAPSPSSRRRTCAIVISIAAVVLLLAIVIPLVAVRDRLTSGRRETTKLSPESTVFTAKSGVTVDVGPYLLDGETTLTVQRKKTKVNREEGYRIVPYEITLDGVTQLDDFLTIRLPYDPDFCARGEDPARCVGAKYLNESTGEWENVPFEVDREHSEIVIRPNHLSTYGVFHVRNERTSRAEILGIHDIYDLETDQALAVLREYVENGALPGDAAVKAAAALLAQHVSYRPSFDLRAATLDVLEEGAGVVTSLTDPVTNGLNIVNMYTLAFPMYKPLAEGVSEKLGNLGEYASAVKIGALMLQSDKAPEDGVQLLKEVANFALGKVAGKAPKAFGVAVSGLWVVDYSLSALFEEGKSIREAEIYNLYRFYNDVYQPHARTAGSWYGEFKKIVNDSADPYEAYERIEQSINDFCNDFWNREDLWADALADKLDIEGKGKAGYARIPPAPTSEEKRKLTEKYRNELFENTLEQVLTRLQVYFQEQLKAQYLSAMEALMDFYNQQIIIDFSDDEAEPIYQNYTLRFEPLPDFLTKKEAQSWSLKLDKRGANRRVRIRLIAFLLANNPDSVALYKPGDKPGRDQPEVVQTYTLTAPETKVRFGLDYDEILGSYAGSIKFKKVRISDPFYTSLHEALNQSAQGKSDQPPPEEEGDDDSRLAQFFKDAEDAMREGMGEIAGEFASMSQADCDDQLNAAVTEGGIPPVISDLVISEKDRAEQTCYLEANLRTTNEDGETEDMKLFGIGTFSGRSLRLNAFLDGDVRQCLLTFEKDRASGAIKVKGKDVPLCMYGDSEDQQSVASIEDLNNAPFGFFYFLSDVDLTKDGAR